MRKSGYPIDDIYELSQRIDQVQANITANENGILRDEYYDCMGQKDFFVGNFKAVLLDQAGKERSESDDYYVGSVLRSTRRGPMVSRKLGVGAFVLGDIVEVNHNVVASEGEHRVTKVALMLKSLFKDEPGFLPLHSKHFGVALGSTYDLELVP